MFKILNGRDYFYQWDLNQKLIVEDDSIDELHFCNGTGNTSLVCRVYEDNGARVADVPNILLQYYWRIKVYGYLENYTKIEKCYEVKKRSKPDDYIYTETEVKRYEALEKRIEELEKGGNIELTPEDMQEITEDVINSVEGMLLERVTYPELDAIMADRDEAYAKELESNKNAAISAAINAAGDLVNTETEYIREEISYMIPYKADLDSGNLIFKSNIDGRDYTLFTAQLPPYRAIRKVSELENDSGFINDEKIPEIAESAAALIDTNLLSAIGGGVLN